MSIEENSYAESKEKLVNSWINSPNYSVKEAQYFDAYVKLFAHLRGTECTFVEIGVLGGGSLFMWRDWLGASSRIIGVDLNPECLELEKHGFEIYIGDQADPDFWEELLKVIGPVDAILDDGGHQSFQQIVTVESILKIQKDRNFTLAVEDTSANFMHDFAKAGKFTFLEWSKAATDFLVERTFALYPGRFPRTNNRKMRGLLENVESIEFFSGIVAFKINPKISRLSEVMINSAQPEISDFRYKGLRSAKVSWPYLKRDSGVRVRGGRSIFWSIQKAVLRLRKKVIS